MATGADIIKGALRRLQVIASETPIEADETPAGPAVVTTYYYEIDYIDVGYFVTETS